MTKVHTLHATGLTAESPPLQRLMRSGTVPTRALPVICAAGRELPAQQAQP